ncbi:MAG TPA: phage tail protein [Actinomycetota bacterium]|nr:phage tail protein [Actinomycetota bacterium]
MSRVHHRGRGSEIRKGKKRKKRPCRSAPSVPANVALNFRKHHGKGERWWNAMARFDAVTTDVAGRTIQPERYVVQMRATDASGEEVETQGQNESTVAYAVDFSVQAGSAATGVGMNRNARELNASPDRIAKTLTGLTTGIAVSVDVNGRKDAGGSSPVVRCLIWNATAGSEVVGKNQGPDTVVHPKTFATLNFTPAAGQTYEVRVQWQSGSGVAIIDQAQWRDKGDAAIWRKRVDGDESPLRATFKDLAKPRAWYYQARVRAMNRVNGTRCYSAWSAWTPATNPVTGSEIGPPAPDGLVLTFHRDEARKKSPFQARALWNETPWWIPPDGEAVEGADRYGVQLAVSENGGSSTLRTRRVSLVARDEDADVTAFYEFANIRRRRHYRFRVRATDGKRKGAWSAWTAWKSPKDDVGNGPGNPIAVTTERVKPGVHVTEWDEPTNPEDVDYYRVRVYVLGVLRKTHKTRSHHYRYIVPDGDRGKAHRFKVTAVDEDENMSAEVDPGDSNDTPDVGVDSFDVGEIRKLTHVTITTWISTHPKWLRCGGQSLATASYPELFAEIGYTYGGAGSTFNLPDLNGRHSVGVSTAVPVGSNDGELEANRVAVHLHATDSFSATPASDAIQAVPDSNFQFADIGFGDQANTPGADFTQETQQHSHIAGTLNTSTNPNTVPRGTSTASAAGPSHGHEILGRTGDKEFGHDHQGHAHGNHGHGHGHGGGNHHHGHGHGGHGHGHNHGGHGHGHGHDQKKRPHQAVWYVIKVLP